MQPSEPREQMPSEDLERVVQQLAEIKRRGLSYQTAATRLEFLQPIVAQMPADSESLKEVHATLQHELALANLEHLSTQRIQQVENALVACEEALRFYTLSNFPYQYANVQVTLGNVYREL